MNFNFSEPSLYSSHPFSCLVSFQKAIFTSNQFVWINMDDMIWLCFALKDFAKFVLLDKGKRLVNCNLHRFSNTFAKYKDKFFLTKLVKTNLTRNRISHTKEYFDKSTLKDCSTLENACKLVWRFLLGYEDHYWKTIPC